jgi:hypothetical protein
MSRHRQPQFIQYLFAVGGIGLPTLLQQYLLHCHICRALYFLVIRPLANNLALSLCREHGEKEMAPHATSPMDVDWPMSTK